MWSHVLAVLSSIIVIYYVSQSNDHQPPFNHKANIKVEQHGYTIDHQSVSEVRWNDIYHDQSLDQQTETIQLRNFLSDYTKHHPRRPLIIRHDDNSVIAKHWKVLDKWTPSHFRYGPRPQRRTLGVFEIYSQTHPVFKTFHDDKPFELYLSNKSLHFDDFNDLKLVRSFTEHIFSSPFSDDELSTDSKSNKNSKEEGNTVYSYYADKMPFLINYFPDLLDDISPNEWIEDSAWSPIQDLMDQHPEIQWTKPDLENVITVRFSSPNQETFMHFDAVWNTFIQIHGTKQFILSSPDHVMYKYPVLHPHSGHSQLDHIWNHSEYLKDTPFVDKQDDRLLFRHFGMDLFEEMQCHSIGECDDQKKKEKKESIALWTVRLEPGDILLIPPYWWHHVISETDSISMHFWLNSIEFLMANREIYAFPLPFELEWSVTLKVYLLRVFFKLMIRLGLLMQSVSRDSVLSMDEMVLKQLFRLRYEPLLIKGMLTINGNIDEKMRGICTESEMQQKLSKIQIDTGDMEMNDYNLDLDGFDERDKISIAKMLDMDIYDEKTPTMLWDRFKATTARVGDKLMLIEENASRLLLSQNYIEYVVNGVLGTEYVFPFFQHCT